MSSKNKAIYSRRPPVLGVDRVNRDGLPPPREATQKTPSRYFRRRAPDHYGGATRHSTLAKLC